LYFDNFNLQEVSIESGKVFIKKLSDLLASLNPPLIDRKKIKIVCEFNNNDEYIEISIPHRTNRIFDLLIYFDEIESTVQLAYANFHFQEYREDNRRIEDVMTLILKIMQVNIEVNVFYKGEKIVKIKPYFLNDGDKKEPFQCSYWNLLSLINPFLKGHKVVERGSFFQ
jgi:hypothetical protein